LTEYLAIKYRYECLVFGEYGKPEPSLRYWLIQCFAYIVIVLVVKSVITLLLQFQFWVHVRALLLWPIDRFLNQEMEIFMVILVIPFFVNVLMFWVTDNFLTMHRTRQYKYSNGGNGTAGDIVLAFAHSNGHHVSDDPNGGHECHNSDDDAELIDISFEPESPHHHML
jgi:hypothetical protein